MFIGGKTQYHKNVKFSTIVAKFLIEYFLGFDNLILTSNGKAKSEE